MQAKFCLVFCTLIGLVDAANQVSSTPVFLPHTTTTSSVVSSSNLANIDNSADDLIGLKRKLEVEKAEAEIKRLHAAGVNTGNSIVQENAQTTVTGVAINQEGKKIAWLQFADGGSLTVNIGSLVGKYVVSDITMTGVRLSYHINKNKTRRIFLKRAYYAVEKSKNQSNSSNKSFFNPSPIITGANTGDSNEMVPPLVNIR